MARKKVWPYITYSIFICPHWVKNAEAYRKSFNSLRFSSLHSHTAPFNHCNWLFVTHPSIKVMSHSCTHADVLLLLSWPHSHASAIHRYMYVQNVLMFTRTTLRDLISAPRHVRGCSGFYEKSTVFLSNLSSLFRADYIIKRIQCTALTQTHTLFIYD